MKSIYARRSIRKYTDRDVEDSVIREIIKAGMNAPSAGNEQPWHFIIIRDRDTLIKINRVHPYSQMLLHVKTAVLICGDLSLEKHEGFWSQDCAAAVQNMLLMINYKGLGSVWLGVYPLKDRVDGIKKIFNLPENIIPFAVLPIGYPDESKPENNKFDESKIHVDKW
ncbi:MAG TPA: nitroreductase family protein [Spirochaetota bacterium]|nr:nitroreductase family protein [Spirochaetota bacterium]HPS87370.1 nitroreductase family protein [Spirochaetota bacterium]